MEAGQIYRSTTRFTHYLRSRLLVYAKITVRVDYFKLMIPTIASLSLFGSCPFAYTQDHSSRDAVQLMVTSWLLAIASGTRIGIYCSDVSGAFDNVCRRQLLSKISGKFSINNVLAS